ncbi:MFS transporter [Agrococcus sp. ProA11]|uniref:MFS transporter n=1 Tax=Agrococcus chionoecetis TaxID=3153752 RepID=UPI003261C900
MTSASAAAAAPATSAPATSGPRGLGAVITSQLLLRIASAAAALVIGSYFVDLSREGVPVGAVLLGVLSGLAYLAELIIAPIAGAASDRRGRRIFLVIAPVLAALGVLLTPGASLGDAAPALILVVAAVGTAQVIGGAGGALAAPATLGLLADATDGDRMRRGRLASLYELASAGGIAVGAALGPILYAITGLGAFAVLAGIYLLAALLVLLFVRDGPSVARSHSVGLRAQIAVFGNRRLLAFLPAWIAVNAILGTWVTAQITYVLAGDRQIEGQLFTGSLAGQDGWLSAILGGYVLFFSACVAAWVFIAGRVPTKATLLVTIGGAVLASVGLILANHGLPLPIAAVIVGVGIFLEAGFTPAALMHLADISGEQTADRGLIMGVYSVVLGLGYLLGNVLGGVFAAWLAFDRLALLTILFAVVGMASVAVMIRVDRRLEREAVVAEGTTA